MKIRPSLSTAITIFFGLIILLGYFVQFPRIGDLDIQQYLLRSTIPLAAIALLVGIANLAMVHWRRAYTGGKGSMYSALFIFSLLVTLLVAGYFGPTGEWSLWIFNYIQVPVEGSLMAILTVALAFAGIRLLRRRLDVFSLVFLGTGALVLLGTAPLFGFELPGIHGASSFRALITQIPAVAGARGILLGVALGSIATGLRVLMGADRPYRG